jgi:gamma-glutamyltranspeptidase/glutathione hydrolase
MKRFFVLPLAIIVLACNTSKKEKVIGLVADSAMVVSAHALASQVGVDIMKQGGNAIDAAIATHFALAVVFPAAGNIGGGGFMVVRLKDGTTATLDFREKAPAAATTNMYLDADGNVIPDLKYTRPFGIRRTRFGRRYGGSP